MITSQELAAVEILRAIPADSLDRLASSAVINNYSPGSIIFREGDEGKSLHVVRKGSIKIVRQGDEGPVTLRRYGPGESFGELAILDPAARSATAIAIESSETIEVSGEDFRRILEEDPTTSRRVLGTLARSLTTAREELTHHNLMLDERVRERTEQLRETQLEVIRRLGRAAEFRDDDTGLHISRMSHLCVRLGRELGLTEDECELLLHAAPMHDIGKIGIPDRVLLKPGKLDDEEWEIMKSHTVIGAELLAGSESAVMQMAQVIALNHHEKWNGNGYPNGIAGESIPLVARVASVCDVFDALISERPYKKAWDPTDAKALLGENAGKDFDPHLVDLFLGLGDEVEEIIEMWARRYRDASTAIPAPMAAGWSTPPGM